MDPSAKAALCLFLCVCVLARSARGGADERLLPLPVGGDFADIRKVPYTVSLQSNGRHSCAGALIDPLFVVTAAHCVSSAAPESLSVRAGSSWSGFWGQVVQVRAVTLHPEFNVTVGGFDVAVLRLSSAVSHPRAKHIELGGAAPPDGEWATVSGWVGLRNGFAWLPVPVHLRSAKVRKVPRQECESARPLTDTMACYGSSRGRLSSCQSDSGRPLAYNNTLVGLASWSVGCAMRNQPAVFTDIPAVLQFILETIAPRSDPIRRRDADNLSQL